jgi:hypothetical protein
MPFFINIVNMKTNDVSQIGSIDIGAVVHNSHTSNRKQMGNNESFGDFSLTTANMITITIDPDIDDQGQIANPSAPITNQI